MVKTWYGPDLATLLPVTTWMVMTITRLISSAENAQTTSRQSVCSLMLLHEKRYKSCATNALTMYGQHDQEDPSKVSS